MTAKNRSRIKRYGKRLYEDKMETVTKEKAPYAKENQKTVNLRFHREIDEDIIKKLDSVRSMREYIRKLIREDIAKEKNQD